MRKKALLLTAVLGTGFILASCGGGGGDSTTASTSDGSTVSAYITDAPADQYPAVEVTLYEVRLTNGTDSVTLFSSTTGVQIDLTDLRNVMRYVGSARIPAGKSFDTVEIVVDGTVKVMKNDGTSLDVSFSGDLPPEKVSCDSSTGRCIIKITGVNVSGGAVAVDFDLRNMVIDETRGKITALEIRPISVDPKTTDKEYEVAGKVKSVDTSTNTFTVDWLSRELRVAVDTTTVCPGMGTGCLPERDWCVEVETSDDPATSEEVRALEIERKKGRRCGEDLDDYTEPKEVKFEIVITNPSNQIRVDKDDAGNITSVSISDTDGDPSISVSSSTMTVNGMKYDINASSVCEFESEMEGMETDAMSRDTEEEEKDRRHRELADDYKKGSNCFVSIGTEINNLHTYLLGLDPTASLPNVEIEFELKVKPKDSEVNSYDVLKLELEIEVEKESSEGSGSAEGSEGGEGEEA